MPHVKILEQVREIRGMIAAHIGAFIGTTAGGYWDIENLEDEAWTTLTVIQLMRLCILFDVAPSLFVPNDVTRSDSQIDFPPDQFGNVHIASVLVELSSDLQATADAIEWEDKALIQWLSDDCNLGEMPVPALDDLCRHLKIDVAQVLTAYWHALGKTG